MQYPHYKIFRLMPEDSVYELISQRWIIFEALGKTCAIKVIRE